MIIHEDEKKLLLSIKVIPLIVFLLIAIIGTSIVLYIHKNNFNNEINKVKNIYLKNEKELLKQEVLKIRNNIITEKNLTEEKLKKNIKDKVEQAYSIMNNIHKQNKDKSKKEILKLVKDALRDIRFNEKRGYFFMYKMDGTNLLLPPRKDLEGKNLIKMKDAKGAYSIRDLRDLTQKKGESFYTWWWYKPNQDKFQSKKIGYAKYFKALDCFVGTGEYVEDFEGMIKKSIAQRLSTYTYGNDSYIFAFDKDGTVLAHIDQSKIGTNNLNDKNTNDVYATYDILSTSSDQGDFLSYSFKKNGEDIETKKISFVVKYEDWDWTIGSGFYTDDLALLIAEKKRELTKLNDTQVDTIILCALVVSLIVVILSLLLSYTIKERFESYKRKVHDKDKLLFQQSKMAAMGEMLESIAHQWRQPLSVITTVTSGLKVQKEYKMLTDDELDDGLNNIQESADHLSQTIDDFRDFYKDNKSKVLFKVSSTIEKSLHLLSSKFKNKNIEIISDIDQIEILGYPNELIQVFMNILNNSRDALDSNKITQKMIFITTETKEDKLIIKFYDNGNGIDKKYLPEIFNHKFTTKSDQDGTGIGLYMSKLIVEKVGGTIIVQNKEFEYEGISYKGAEFIITLPL